jgi:CHASE2 domain-containing sensor protein
VEAARLRLRCEHTGIGSLPDCVYEALFQKLAQYQPRAIGLDIYRADRANQAFAVAADAPTLDRSLRQHPHTFAVCKAALPEAGLAGVEPPPEVPMHRLGFTDFVGIDAEGVMRRHLLWMQVASSPNFPNPCPTSYAFNVKLALHYLNLQPIWTNGALQIGNVTVLRLNQPAAGYQAFDAGGYQTLLNYRAPGGDPSAIARRVSLGQVLRDNTATLTKMFQGKIVLIGRTDRASEDFWVTPYGGEQVPGVVLQAQMISQILSAVLRDQYHRPLLQHWASWQEDLWVWGWVAGTTVICWRGRDRPGRFVFMQLAIMGSLYLSCAVGFIQFGVWIPLVPPMIALIAIAATSLIVYTKPQ